MRAWRVNKGAASVEDLVLVEQEKPQPAFDEVLIKIRACSLNFRDQLIVSGQYPVDRDITPLSDGVGVVEAVGVGVTAFAVGDRVAGTFFQQGSRTGLPNGTWPALGATPAKGMLAEYVTLPEIGVIPIASSLTFEEASTLPCSGLTAWNALMGGPARPGPGRVVLLQGTGGVSLLALQLAKAAGARIIVTSSSDEKLARALTLGADLTINYRAEKQWGHKVASLADGGADHILEIGQPGTLAQSMLAVRPHGEIALLNTVGETNMMPLMFKGASLRGIAVGSSDMARALNHAIDVHAIRPVIDRIFPFDEAREAYLYQASSSLFGKVAIAM